MMEKNLNQILDRIPKGWFQSLDIGPGWYDLVIQLDRDISSIDPNYELLQCKEKFGGLRYYYRTTEDHIKIDDLIRQAEIKSYVTCEDCGEPSTTQSDDGWIHTLCDIHRKERDERRTKR